MFEIKSLSSDNRKRQGRKVRFVTNPLNGAVKSMGTDNSRGGDFTGATRGGERGSWGFDSCSTRANTDVGGYLIPLICPMIKSSEI